MKKVMEMKECSKLCKWVDGMVPSESKGWCFSGPMKSSMEMDMEEPTMIRKSSMYLIFVGNHGEDV